MKGVLVVNPCRHRCVCYESECRCKLFEDALRTSQDCEWIFDRPSGSIVQWLEDSARNCANVLFLWPSPQFLKEFECYSSKKDGEKRDTDISQLKFLLKEFNHDSLSRNNRGNFVIHVTFKRECLPKPIAKWVSPVLMLNDYGFNFQELLATINEEPLRIEDMSPCGHIAHGLAWTFYAGYLRDVVEPFESDGKAKVASDNAWATLEADFTNKNFPSGHQLFGKRVIILPASGETEGVLSCYQTSGFSWDTKRNKGGVVGRPYSCTVYSVEDDEDDENEVVHHVLIEYCTPIDRMRKMMKSAIAGMSEKWMEFQIAVFKNDLMTICETNGEFDNIIFLWFEDKEITDPEERCRKLGEEILNVVMNNQPIGMQH